MFNRISIVTFIVIFSSCSLFNDESDEQWLTENDYPHYRHSSFELADHYKIWDKGRHNAFTDIIYHKKYYYIVFREASCCHFSHDGSIRVIRSKDTKEWESIAQLSDPVADMRDPKLNITPLNNLTISATARKYKSVEDKYAHRTYIWSSENGTDWTEPEPISDSGYWFWRFRWNYELNKAFGFSYKTGDRFLNLHTSPDWKSFSVSTHNILSAGRPTEADLVFVNDSLAISLVRREKESNSMMGFSKKPFLDWTWDELDVNIASPNMILLPDQRLAVSGRIYEPKSRTAIYLIDPVNKKLTEALKLPSGGDNGYPGMLLKDDELVISYYSSHEEQTVIYLARVKLN